MSSGAASGEPPGPGDATTLDELIGGLRALRAWAGVSYRELHRRLLLRRRALGVAEEPAYATVYRCLQSGRSRLDIELVVDIVAVLVDDDVETAQWRQAYARLDGKSTAAAYATVSAALPDDVGDFTGRHAELTALALGASATTEPGAARVLAIEGMAGVGKTTLAVHAAHRIAAEGRHDVILSVNLCGYDPQRAPMEPAAVLDGFLRLLGEPGQRIQRLDLSERTHRYRALLAGRPALILLDNAAGEDQIEPLLPDDPAALVIVTSRPRVVHSPAAYHLPLEVFTSEQALDLLRRRAGTAIDVDPDTAARLAEQVGRLPLAVALVGSRIDTMPGWTLADHLEHLVECGVSLRLDPGVELAFTTSYEALPPSLRRLLRLLALHPGRDCDSYAAAALAGIELDTAARRLGELTAGNLLSTPATGRYELHDLVRIFALNRAQDEDPPSSRRKALTRLFDHYRWATTLAMDTYAPAERERRPDIPRTSTATPPLADRQVAKAWLETEQPNLLAVAVHAADHGWPHHSSGLSALLAPYLLSTAQFDAAEMLHGHASRIATDAARGVALKDLATSRWHRGRRQHARTLLEEAFDIAANHGDLRTQSRAIMNLAVVLRYMGLYDQAIEASLKAIALFRQQGDQRGDCWVLGNLGIIYAALGQWDEAMDHQRRALALTHELSDRGTESRILENLSRLYDRLGRHAEAQETAERAASLAHQVGDLVGESEALTALGLALAGRGRPDAAVAPLRDSLSIAESVASSQCEVNAHNALGDALLLEGRSEDALAHYRAALAAAEELEDPLNEANAHQGLLRCYAARRDGRRARSHGQQALTIYTRLGVPDVNDVERYLKEI